MTTELTNLSAAYAVYLTDFSSGRHTSRQHTSVKSGGFQSTDRRALIHLHADSSCSSTSAKTLQQSHPRLHTATH